MLALAVLAACASRDLTEIVVTIEPDEGVRALAANVSLEVRRTQDGSLIHRNPDLRWNEGRHTLVLSPTRDQRAEPYRLEVHATRDAQPIAVARLISGYVVGETRYIRMRLEASCSDVCDAVTTCRAAGCVGAHVDPHRFGESLETAPLSTAVSSTVEASPVETVPVATTDAPAQPQDAGPRDGAETLPPVAVRAIDAISDYTCATAADGLARCWGKTVDGTVFGRTRPVMFRPPERIDGLADVVEFAGGLLHTCARIVDGRIFCWGDNSSGQLGDGSTTTTLTPLAVRGLSDAVQLVAGQRHSCVRRPGGDIRCWGSNASGQLGSDVRSAAEPTAVPGMQEVLELASGTFHTCARRQDATVYCWGANNQGQLGRGGAPSASSSHLPAPVVGLSDVVALSAACDTSCAVTRDGNAYCWGENSAGQTGSGSIGDRTIPTRVLGLPPVESIAVGELHACAVARDHTVLCWGDNRHGQLGNGTVVHSFAPVRVLELGEVSELTAGNGHVCARQRTDERLVCWGNNADGQLSDGTLMNRRTPMPIVGL